MKPSGPGVFFVSSFYGQVASVAYYQKKSKHFCPLHLSMELPRKTQCNEMLDFTVPYIKLKRERERETDRQTDSKISLGVSVPCGQQ